tara:strand:+ start:538 stop:2103 length:1566 start_codon:yes stop_codon:yes gene_type:complete
MSLLQIEVDLLTLVYGHFHADRLGATKVWRLACKAMRDSAPNDQHSWLRAMGVSTSLIAFFLNMEFLEVQLGGCHKAIWVNGVRKSNYHHELILATVKGGNPEVLHKIQEQPWVKNTGLLGTWERRGGRHDDVITYTAAKAGDLDMLKALLTMGLKVGQWTCAGAARGGHLHILDWLLTMRSWLLTRRAPSSRRLINPVSHLTDDPTCTFHDTTLGRDHHIRLKEQFACFCLKVLVAPAVQSKNLDIVKSIIAYNSIDEVAETGADFPGCSYVPNTVPSVDFHEEIAEKAVYEDSVDIFEYASTWLADNMSDEAFEDKQFRFADLASECQAVRVLQYIFEQMGDAFCTDLVYDSWSGGVEVFKWLVEKAKMPVNGHHYLNILCMSDTQVVLELLDYLYAIKCDQTSPHEIPLDFYEEVACFRGLDALKRIEWLWAHDFEINGILAMETAIRNDELGVAQKLHELGCVLTEDRVRYFRKQEYWNDDGDVADWIRRWIDPTPDHHSSHDDAWFDAAVLDSKRF